MCFTGLFHLYIAATQQVGKTKDALSALKTAAAVPKIMSLLTLPFTWPHCPIQPKPDRLLLLKESDGWVPTSLWWMPVYWQGSMPHTPTERSFDINFHRCGGKTKCRRKAHELCSGLSSTRTRLGVCACVFTRFCRPLWKHANEKCQHTQTPTQSQVELRLKNVPRTPREPNYLIATIFH